MKNEKGFAERCIKAHMKAFETWPYGSVEGFWRDYNGDLCIRYSGGVFWHYKETEDGEIIWW